MPFGRRGAFFYYSLTRLGVEGRLRLRTPAGGTETVPVRGLGWYDHQWGPFYVTPFRTPSLEEYEWMSIQLDSGEELLLTTVWEADGRTPSLPAYGGAGLVRRDGTTAALVGAHRWRRTKFWRSPEQHGVYAAGWTFDAPEWAVSLRIEPRTLDQLTPVVDAPPPGLIGAASRLVSGVANHLGAFWEGSCRVQGTCGGAPVSGVAFAELVKRYEDPVVRASVMRDGDGDGPLVVRWHVTNPDEQVPLRHRAFVERAGGTVVRAYPDLLVPVLVLDDPSLPTGEPLNVRVVAESCDGTLSGTATTRVELG
jgi:hypothetical protein